MRLNLGRKGRIIAGVLLVGMCTLVVAMLAGADPRELMGTASLGSDHSDALYLRSAYDGTRNGCVILRNDGRTLLNLTAMQFRHGIEKKVGSDRLGPGEQRYYNYKGIYFIHYSPFKPTVVEDNPEVPDVHRCKNGLNMQ
ncbi:MAG TPA: hypothetical protein VHS28_02485 [Chloroflexota bacterium]|nr:hypothetical protein [Chloroflexota bacterium]